jgi:hypothetical protein
MRWLFLKSGQNGSPDRQESRNVTIACHQADTS